VYKEKSQKMKGEGNHNFGKHKSEETKKKLSTSIRDAKNGISDDKILNVRELIQQDKKNIEIQQLLNLPRHIVTRIKNGIIVCRTEIKEEKKVLSKEEQNIQKRKILLNEILIIIDKSLSGDKPMVILDYLHDLRLKNKIDDKLTIDIIKNLRRIIFQGKVPFYKSEVSQEKYEEYELKIANYIKNLNT
jgi:hypothetical protein